MPRIPSSASSSHSHSSRKSEKAPKGKAKAILKTPSVASSSASSASSSGKSSKSKASSSHKTPSRAAQLESMVPELDEDYYDARPTTPNGTHEFTPLNRVLLDKRGATQSQLAYTRLHLELIAGTSRAVTFNQALNSAPADREVVIKTTNETKGDMTLPVADKSLRENGQTITQRDRAVGYGNSYYLTEKEPKALQEMNIDPAVTGPILGHGASSIISHNPFTYIHSWGNGVETLDHVGLTQDPDAAFNESATGLGHELQHAYHFATGTASKDQMLEEVRSTEYVNESGLVENALRMELGMETRNYFNADKHDLTELTQDGDYNHQHFRNY